MALNKKPVNGMKDILPYEMEVRDYVTSIIKDTYRSFGFTPIETPAMESIGNLSNKQGGENEKLIFKVMKRGEKLNIAEATTEEQVVDFGMRYDLTVPLCRFYSNHANELTSPFKALQIGSVWRADRPQRGRYRQFTQCDIDILGEPSNLAEIELILATTTTLGRIGFKNFEIRINERRILKAMAAYAGFSEEDYDSIFITLDKMDKIGLDGVSAELLEAGYSKESIDKYVGLFAALEGVKDVAAGMEVLLDKLGEFLDTEVADWMREIATAVNATKEAQFELVFDPTLVRGMSYYTGTIFEIAIPEFGGSCGGGGRYDKMIGNFTGQNTPACGFSIGFERIILLLMEQGFKVPGANKKVAYLVEKGYPAEKLAEVMAQAKAAREQGQTVLVVRMNKNKKFQKEQLTNEGYEEFVEFFNR
ncbi:MULTISPECIES: histidine--tRNA ligase [Pseudobutyrivibrio]|jgi:histidyl-tRNA synthetase|uniref:Histidine--tRNA ligase n=1 Tax=Pseudobutyrivibrio xylanivorans TaxID=185007 RepID=A0A6M0LDU6_PSEXY|nr:MULTISPECIES: histidine--tRNA ligase [Pseudobutyrivibrio]MBE5903252.1 histidine--tRNA ligase [Pseudobutyrivibrio sp.]MBR5951878.1 histidine--tRNA ligase [Pseudobutyrivibrio sp.]NEX00626.1 histidine--tRNA ligase [Pseudobutyrivibrio xylanivorans]SFR61599.1 histidyl-tRNA synthetase [Pseudobutyrivibrio sp. NOR37]